MKSIFDLERRFDFNKEYNRLLGYLEEDIFINEDSIEGTFWEVADTHFRKWPYRLTALSADDYLTDLNLVDYTIAETLNDEEKMYCLEFLINYTGYLIKNFIDQDNDEYIAYSSLTNNIITILEKLNYKTEEINDKILFTKRDADVDSVLNIIEDMDIRNLLLSFNDFRIENNINEKKIILKKLGDYLEPQRKKLSSFNKSLTDDIFFILNSFDIRHNNIGTLEFKTTEEHLEWYDKLFKMIIQLIRTEEISKIQKELKEYKK